jgi:hypothetical protein
MLRQLRLCSAVRPPVSDVPAITPDDVRQSPELYSSIALQKQEHLLHALV